MNGYVKLYRKLKDWQWKDVPNMVALWVDILLTANYYENEWHGKKFEAGSFPTSLSKLSASTGLTIQQVRTCLKNLESTKEITITSTSHGTKINVNNWEEYQGDDDDCNKPSNKQTNRQTTDKQQTINNTIRNKERKNERNIYIRKRADIIPSYDDSVNGSFDESRFNEIMQRRSHENQTVQ